MLEAIRTFFGKVRGPRTNRQTIVVEGRLWRCTKCALLFLTEKEGVEHKCMEAFTK